MLMCGIIGWLLSAIITGILVVKVEKCDPKCWDDGEIILLALFWPIALIIITCEVCVMYIFYVKTKKERVENLKQEKRNEVENVLKEI